MSLRAGEVDARAGVNLQTLRYHERRGILAAPDRSPGGHR
ncbi:MerR family DNA-binding transcriptional regulator [Agromyces sp. Soil535]|nr:MerR family DNA-binding transcriptional regulator [Agromyces sp. Soil535]